MKSLYFLILIFSSTTFASRTFNLANRFGVGVNGGYAFPIQGNSFDEFAGDEVMWGLHARYNFTPSDGLMLNYSHYEFENTPINANVFDLMYVNRINEGDKMTPFWGLGAGVANMGNIAPFHDGLKFAARARAGFEYSLTNDLVASIFADYQFVGKMPYNTEDEDTRDEAFPGGEIYAIVPQVALTWYFGPDREMPQKHHPKPVPVPVPVQDDDKDGISNNLDKCPGTPEGMLVNDYGCKPEEKVTMRLKVLFPTGAYALGKEADPHLDHLAEFMQSHPGTKLEIQGHTDDVGSSNRNQKLSDLRANAIKAYLVEKADIDPSRITARGFGDNVPISDNSSAAGRSENRRVIGIITQ